MQKDLSLRDLPHLRRDARKSAPGPPTRWGGVHRVTLSAANAKQGPGGCMPRVTPYGTSQWCLVVLLRVNVVCVAGPAQHQLAGPGFLNMDPEFVHSFRDYITEMIDATKPEIMDDQASPTCDADLWHATCPVACAMHRAISHSPRAWTTRHPCLPGGCAFRAPAPPPGAPRPSGCVRLKQSGVCAHVCR